jgi:Type I restriction modification DNA specificity domain
MTTDDVGTIFDIEGGNSGLTEEFIYLNQPTTDEDAILIHSAATVESNLMGPISRYAKPNGKQLKIFSGPAILVRRNGQAGSMTYIPTGEFTTTDHAYVLIPKEHFKDRVNLRWFTFQYQELFKNLVTSKSDNATFSKEYAEKQKVTLPTIEIQNRISGKLQKIDLMIKEMDDIKEKLSELKESKWIE